MITRRCNLYCKYCDHASMRKASHKESFDYGKIVENLRRYTPKIVNISGGEPTLVEQLPQVLAEIKEGWNPFIRVVHNGTNPGKIIPCLPYMDRLAVSMDGPDPINKDNRGISAETVLKKLKEVLPEIFSHNVEVIINCVCTTANLGFMREFLESVRGVSPRIGVSFTPIIPPGDTLSITREESDFRRFLSSFDDLKKKGYFVNHAFDGILRHKDFNRISCFNQFFAIRITPEGRIVTCAMNTEMNGDHYAYFFRRLFSKKGLEKALNRITKMTRQKLLESVDFSCTTMCACENWLDLIFLGIPSDNCALYARGLYGRMTQEDYDNAEAFVRKFINPEFKGSAFKAIVDTSQ
jgi:MoaA/NifB/PqqE/SkfB family radical SAM enzyme